LEFISIALMCKLTGRTWNTVSDGGLFGRQPYLILREITYNEKTRAGCEMHYVIRVDTSKVEEYCICYQVYEPGEVKDMALTCGFSAMKEYGSMEGEPYTSDSDWLVAVIEK